MRILITGATGFVGRSICKALVLQGHQIVILSRNPDVVEERLSLPCEAYHWNADRATIDPAALSEIDGAILLAGEPIATLFPTKRKLDRIRRSRIQGCEMVLKALHQAKQQLDFVLGASAIGYYGDQGETLIDEATAGGNDFLATLCKDWEEVIDTHAPGLARRHFSVRIGLVLGRNQGALAPLETLFRSGLAGRIGSGQQWQSWIHIDDLVSMILFAISNKDVRQTFNAVSPQPLQNFDFTKKLAKTLQRFALLPAPKVGIKLALGKLAPMLLASQRVQPNVMQECGFEWKHPDIEQALTALFDHNGTTSLLQTQQWFNHPIDEVFEFFSNAYNLQQITPPHLKFRIQSMSTEQVAQGSLIDYRLKMHGLPMHWRSEILNWQPPSKFVDEQIIGPYKTWHHTHTFEELAGGTLVSDDVAYQGPGGYLGWVFGAALIRREIEKIFHYRRKSLKEIFPQKVTEE